METVANRPLIDYVSFLQMIIDTILSKENPTKSELRTLEDAKKEMNKFIKYE